MTMLTDVAVLTAGVAAACWMAVRANCPGCRRLICLTVCDEVAQGTDEAAGVEVCGYVRTVADAEVFIAAVQGMHAELLRHRPAVLPDGTEMVEIYKGVQP